MGSNFLTFDLMKPCLKNEAIRNELDLDLLNDQSCAEIEGPSFVDFPQFFSMKGVLSKSSISATVQFSLLIGANKSISVNLITYPITNIPKASSLKGCRSDSAITTESNIVATSKKGAYSETTISTQQSFGFNGFYGESSKFKPNFDNFRFSFFNGKESTSSINLQEVAIIECNARKGSSSVSDLTVYLLKGYSFKKGTYSTVSISQSNNMVVNIKTGKKSSIRSVYPSEPYQKLSFVSGKGKTASWTENKRSSDLCGKIDSPDLIAIDDLDINGYWEIGTCKKSKVDLSITPSFIVSFNKTGNVSSVKGDQIKFTSYKGVKSETLINDNSLINLCFSESTLNPIFLYFEINRGTAPQGNCNKSNIFKGISSISFISAQPSLQCSAIKGAVSTNTSLYFTTTANFEFKIGSGKVSKSKFKDDHFLEFILWKGAYSWNKLVGESFQFYKSKQFSFELDEGCHVYDICLDTIPPFDTPDEVYSSFANKELADYYSRKEDIAPILVIESQGTKRFTDLSFFGDVKENDIIEVNLE